MRSIRLLCNLVWCSSARLRRTVVLTDVMKIRNHGSVNNVAKQRAWHMWIFVIKKFWARSGRCLPSERTARHWFTSIVKSMEITLPIKLLFAVSWLCLGNGCTMTCFRPVGQRITCLRGQLMEETSHAQSHPKSTHLNNPVIFFRLFEVRLWQFQAVMLLVRSIWCEPSPNFRAAAEQNKLFSFSSHVRPGIKWHVSEKRIKSTALVNNRHLNYFWVLGVAIWLSAVTGPPGA